MFLFLSVQTKKFVYSLILAIVTAIFVVVIPSFSQAVQITPSNPQLGDIYENYIYQQIEIFIKSYPG